MGDQPWLTGAERVLQDSGAGLVTPDGRVPWRVLLERARRVAHRLPPSSTGWVVAPRDPVRAVIGLLATGLCPRAPRWVVGDPHRWSTGGAAFDGPDGDILTRASADAAPPPEVRGPTYATPTSGSTGSPRLLFGRPSGLVDAAGLYAADLPEYRDAEVFAACSSMDFGATLYTVVAPALAAGRDLVVFPPRDWARVRHALDGRAVVCLAAPAAALLGARVLGEGAGRRTRGWTLVPAGGGMTAERAARVAAGMPGCGFLGMLGSTETGLLTVTRDVAGATAAGRVGRPLPGKPVWLEGVGADGVGMLWTRGPDTRFAATAPGLRTAPGGAVSAGDLAHGDGAGGYVLDGRVDDLLKVDGVTVYPRAVTDAVRALPGVDAAEVRVDRAAAGDRVVVTAVGRASEADVRRACADLPTPVVPHRVVVLEEDHAAYSDRGKVLR